MHYIYENRVGTALNPQPNKNRRNYPDTPLVGVGAMICRDDDILLIRRAAPPSVGKWSIPGGLVEIGESIWDACRREVIEETGVDVDLTGILDVNEMVERDETGRILYHFVLIGFEAAFIGGEVCINQESTDWAWTNMMDTQTMDITRTTKRLIVAKLAGRISFSR